MTSPRHLLDFEGYGRDDVLSILDAAEAFFEVSRRPVRKVPTLRGKTIINLFYENSTRTRTSFELAGKRLSADVVNMSVAASSVKKGETLSDTVRTLEAMQPDVIVMRHGASGAPHFVAKRVRCAVVNAGDGTHAHPTQALLDAFTIRRRVGRLDNLIVAICGDIAHSRVARSAAELLALFGAEVRVTGPRTLLPRDAAALGVRVMPTLESALEGVDVVMMLRIQQERLGGTRLPSLREYSRTFGLNRELLGLAKPGALVMHPGPMNRGVEISPEVADGPSSAVLDQVEAGVAVRMAVLYRMAGEGASNPAEA
ncbi:MAG: aspartate carbamoyltransferase catalytic subunit [Deltaproteobacteria bacterium]|nr:aspartate carbamoyltransferase catalytic subunit [Deltaproteobacteria bacterium]